MAEVAGRFEKRPYSVALGERIAELHEQGLEPREIAERAGCSVRSVQRWRSANGLTRPVSPFSSRRISSERLALAAEMIADGASHSEIWKTLRITRATLQRHFPGTAWDRQQAAEATAMSRKLRAL